MNIHSLRSKITLIFLFSFLSLVAFFAFYLNTTHQNLDKKVLNSYNKLSTYFRQSKIKPYDIDSYLENFGFKADKNARTIMKKGQKIANERGYEAYFYKKNYYYHVQRKGYRRLFKDLNHYENSPLIYFVFSFVLLLLLLVYFWLLKSLNPLKELQHNISKFAQGDLTISCKSPKKDEIAIVSNEFDNAVKQINLLLNSRQLFLRTVMHELKTPIAKGRIVSSLIEDEIQEKRLIFIFEKLEYLINDFAKIEEIVSNNYSLKKRRYAPSSIIDKAIGMLLLDNISDKIEIKLQNDEKIEADIDLLAMVLKNLLDNALKYASDNKAVLYSGQYYIQVASYGTKLSKPINSYFKPFHNEIKMQNQGMGLGLYIVKSIVDMHQMKLEYLYQDEMNIFRIRY
jgi:two-component system OmpR family sensor kinase